MLVEDIANGSTYGAGRGMWPVVPVTFEVNLSYAKVLDIGGLTVTARGTEGLAEIMPKYTAGKKNRFHRAAC